MPRAKRRLTGRKKQAQETKNRIYTTAIDLMDRKGFEKLTIADISREAGVSVGSFYNYFTSKNDILAEIFQKADDYFSTHVLPSLRGRDVPNQIVEYFVHYAKFNVRTGVDTTKELFSPKIKFFIKKGRPMAAILQQLIQKGLEKREISSHLPAEELARFLFVVARGVVFDWSLHEGRYDLEATMRKYVTSLVSTFVASF